MNPTTADPMDTMLWPRREVCPVCLDLVALTKGGTFRRHGDHNNATWWCGGSQTMPPGHVHRCHCGCRWDERVGETNK